MSTLLFELVQGLLVIDIRTAVNALKLVTSDQFIVVAFKEYEVKM